LEEFVPNKRQTLGLGLKSVAIFGFIAGTATIALKALAPEGEQIYILREQFDQQLSQYSFQLIGTVAGARTIALPETGGYVLVLTDLGRVWTWGSNSGGQLGNGNILAQDGWAAVTGLDEVSGVAAGALHSVALKGDGTVWTWGGNDQGQLGDGTLVNRPAPGAVPGLTGVTMVAAGGASTLALRMDGTVWAFGANWNEIVPGEGRHSILEPLQVTGLKGMEAIAVFHNRGYAKDNQGQVWVWGKAPEKETSTPTPLSKSEIDALPTAVARQLGLSHPTAPLASEWAGNLQRNRTVRVDGSSLDVLEGAKESQYPFEGTVVDVNWGWAVALITAPEAKNASTKTPDSASAGVANPAQIPTRPAAMVDHPQIVSTIRTPLAAKPASLAGLNPSDPPLAAGGNQSLTVKSDGTLWGWGANNVGQLCDGTTDQQVVTPVQSQITGVAQVATSTLSPMPPPAPAAPPHTLALKTDASVWGCGSNAYGQLGDGTTVNRSTPVQILTGAVAVGTGQYHSIALKSDGTVWGWGNNGTGQVGDGTTTQRLTPVQVVSLTGVVAISAGYEHNMALKTDGTVWTWGYNGWGQLGDGTTTNRISPVQVPNLTGVVAIAAGEDHSVVLKNDGTVWSWGDGHLGQLGNGLLGFEFVPVQATGLTNVSAIAAGDYHTLALRSDGSVWDWGYNNAGQLANSTSTIENVPVQVSGLTGVTAVAGGNSHSVALKSDGTIWAWGDNSNGQLGNASTRASTIPIMVQSTAGPGPALRFIPVTPCRVADTRSPVGPFGGPFIAANTSRSFTVPSSACSIPSTAQAYSFNITVVPHGSLSYLTVWPTGQTQPYVSTLNSLDGRIKANAAIVPAGSAGAISVFATHDTDAILDIDGYFVLASDAGALAFYPMAPCRLVDTRSNLLSAGALTGGVSRTLPLRSSSCNIPTAAQAYSLNFTVVPHGVLSYLTVWPTGQTRPLVSTLNDPTGTNVANAAIVPEGTAGSIDVFATQTTDLVVDINGYFAPAGAGGLSLYNLPPCRVLDTRNPLAAPFTGSVDVDVIGSGCGGASGLQGYVLNATVVPSGDLAWLTLWPQGAAQPTVSTLNALDGAITSNMAIVPTSNTEISAYASGPNSTQLILDISGYFAP
jgi:alpha-tubulin suppressor-like RCC1 family protein